MIGQRMARALAALLLAFAILSPAAAEVVWASETAPHAVAEAAAEPISDDDGQLPDHENRCAVSHGHCGGVVPAVRLQLDVSHSASLFATAPSDCFVSRVPLGLDRPPRS